MIAVLVFSLTASAMKATPLISTEHHEAGISGYLRTGIGTSEGGKTQAAFQVPGARNKFSLGNQPDTYGELEFDYTYWIDRASGKSLDLVWMLSAYGGFDGISSDFGDLDINNTEQLYMRANNLFGNEIDVWVGQRFYERNAIHMLDRQWNNAGQQGTGAGIEGLLGNKPGEEDVKFAVFKFSDDAISYKNGEYDELDNYKFDVRWVHIPLTDTLKLNLNANYTYRDSNESLGYDAAHGFGLATWVDYAKEDITDTFAVIYRQGAEVPVNHWNIASEKENPGNDNIIRNDLDQAFSLEINNNFLYDNQDTWALNFISLLEYRDHGTAPHPYQGSDFAGTGDKMLWLSLGGRGIYYVSDKFRLTLEVSNDYINNQQENVSGNLSLITFGPEFSLSKGYYSRPVLRPFITYAEWSGDLEGYVGAGPGNAPYVSSSDGFTAGVQFEIWW
jgi:maltoporin